MRSYRVIQNTVMLSSEPICTPLKLNLTPATAAPPEIVADIVIVPDTVEPLDGDTVITIGGETVPPRFCT